METTTTLHRPAKRFRPSDRDRYIAFVLWLHGLSATEIALLLHKTRKSTLGICQRSPYGARASMTLSDRQEALDELWAIRKDENGVMLDGGLLPARVFKPRPLDERQDERKLAG